MSEHKEIDVYLTTSQLQKLSNGIPIQMNKAQFFGPSGKTNHHIFLKISHKIHDKIVKRLSKYKSVKIKHDDILGAGIMDTMKSFASNDMVQNLGKKALSAGMDYAIKKGMNSENSKIAGLANNDLSRNIGKTLMNKGFDYAKQSENQVEYNKTLLIII